MFSRDLEENRKEIKQINEKIFVLASAVQTLSDKIDANAKTEAAARNILVLELENQLLRSLPKSQPSDGRDSVVITEKNEHPIPLPQKIDL